MTSTVITIDRARAATSAIAMTLTLLSLSMLFMTLLLGYAIFRFNSVIWPPMGMARADIFYPVISSTFIALSSLSYIAFEHGLQRGVERRALLHFTGILGVGFLFSQGLFWQSLEAIGLYASSGIFPSLLYGLTWTHGGHICLALFFLGLLILRKRKFQDRETELLWVRNIGQFWHFLGIVWFILYLSIFVF